MLISEQDLQQAAMAFKVASNLVVAAPVKSNHQQVITKAAQMACSELIQGACR